MAANPYAQQSGFGLRVQYASKCLLIRGTLPHEQRGEYHYDKCASRQFDNCFENNDGDAVVFALMEKAEQLPQLANGIKSLGGSLWDDWCKVYEAGKLLQANQLELFN